MEITVQGWRASAAEWDAVRGVPSGDLPALSPEQKEVAQKLGVSEEDYARSVLAGRRTQDILLQKAEALGAFLERRISGNGGEVQINRVVLDVVEHKFTIELSVNGKPRLLRIEESLVDDYLDSGSADSEESLGRIFDRALLGVTA